MLYDDTWEAGVQLSGRLLFRSGGGDGDCANASAWVKCIDARETTLNLSTGSCV